MRTTPVSLWKEYATESMRDNPADPRDEMARRTVVVLVTAAVALTGMQYTRSSVPDFWYLNVSPGDESLSRLMWWALATVFWFVVPGLMLARLYLKIPIKELGLGRFGVRRHLGVYILMLLIMIPLVTAVSFTQHFQDVYPFYRPAVEEGISGSLGIWWLGYALQFLGLEFFFRGFMIHSLKPHLGFASIPVMMVPYAMIHFRKPLLETCGAILAGLALGALSLRTKSIWLGAALHISVAATMDIASLAQHGVLW